MYISRLLIKNHRIKMTPDQDIIIKNMSLQMKARIYHNPQCSKSRTTKALLESEGIELDVIEYIKTPLNAETIIQLLNKLSLTAADLIRAGEATFKKSGIELTAANEIALIELMVKEPRLIERPIVETDQMARIGRPPEKVLELFR